MTSGASVSGGRKPARTMSKSSTITGDRLPNPHPGEILLQEFLQPMDLSQTALARAIHVPPRRINEIVLRKRAVTADTDLLRRHPKDAGAWDRFVRRYRPKIYGWCRERGLQEADADDVAQDVIAILTRKMASFRYDPSRRFHAWLKRITYHALSDLIARRCRAVGDRPTPLPETIEDRVDLERRIDELFDRELLELAMSRVRQRVAAATWNASSSSPRSRIRRRPWSSSTKSSA